MTKKITNKDKKFMTLGFKLLSGNFNKGISQNDYSSLGKNDDVPWGKLLFEKKIEDISEMMSNIYYFRYWGTWKKPLIKVVSENAAINYLLLILKDYERKNEPNSGSDLKNFKKNCFILFDKTIYEYITRQWSGSSDSKVKDNLKSIEEKPSLFEPISHQRWESLLKEMINEGTINGNPYTNIPKKNKSKYRIHSSIEPVLLHYYCMQSINGPMEPMITGYDKDHIIPESLFNIVLDGDINKNRCNITNIALIPNKDNKKKRDKKLSKISDRWLIDQIEKYAEIEEEDFNKYSDAQDINNLIVYRGKLILDAFNTKRELLLKS